MARDKLYQRIEERINKMFRKGLVKEAAGLLKLKLSRTASLRDRPKRAERVF